MGTGSARLLRACSDGPGAKVDEALFDAIHVQNQKLGNREALVAWMATRGVDTAKFSALLDSTEVDRQVKAADARVMGYKVRASAQ